jgi:hypothetical protein
MQAGARPLRGLRQGLQHIKAVCEVDAEEGILFVTRMKVNAWKSFANIIPVIRLHLMSHMRLMESINDTFKAWIRTFDLQG